MESKAFINFSWSMEKQFLKIIYWQKLCYTVITVSTSYYCYSSTIHGIIYILYSGLLSRGNIFTSFTSWTQFVPCETLFIESLISTRVQLFVKLILIKCDSTVHSRNISASKITHYTIVRT